jgi:hypothetical protein
LQLFHLFCLRSGPSPLSSGAFHTTAAVTSFPIFKVAGRVPLLLPFLASLFIYSLPKGLPLPHFPGLGCPSLFAVSFFVLLIQLLVYYLVFFFSFLFPPPAPRWKPQGAMLIWPIIVCGGTMCCLAHLVVCIFPSSLGADIWRCRSPSGFSI